ncbi:hypothetical protein AAG570_001601 [Ranatra chinensis]|uniref:Uncharacterized protein n=1 Tax=Ranatra chinensis TaxID=642074 RepID=A0ABD0Y908_9HEMI
MAPEIEIWDLDVINPVEPVSKLGFHSEKKKHAHRNSGHRDAVLDLSWNPGFPHIMASGSVDKTAILWDLETHKDSTVIKNFAGNVESVAWHSQEGQTLLTASADSSVKVFDCRYEETFKSWSVEGEALIAKWDPCRPFLTTVGTSTGRLYGFDIRSADPLWSTEEHGKDVSGLAMAPTVQGLLISAHVDGIVKVWDVRSTTPTLVFTKEASIGQIHAFDLNPDAPYIGCVGGTKKSKNFKLMDFSKIKEIVEHFSTSA